MNQWRYFVWVGLIALAPVASAPTAGAASADLNATATIFKGITVTEDVPLNFGTIAIPTVGTECTLFTIGLNNFTSTSGTCSTLGPRGDGVFVSGALTGRFTINGEPSATVTVGLSSTGDCSPTPATAVLLRSFGFNRNDGGPATGSALDGTTGDREVQVKGGLQVTGAAPTGIVNCTYGVNVDY